MAIGEPVPSPQGDDEAARSADAGLPASTFDTVRRGFAPDQVAEYLQRVTTLVLSLEARLSEMTSELLQTKRERDDARAALDASAGRDPNTGASDRVTELVHTFDLEVGGLLRDAEVERIRANARKFEQESQIRAGRLLKEAREEADRAESHLGTVRGRILDTFRDVRERTITALGEVEAVIESGATPDRLVILDEVIELAGDEAPELATDDAAGLSPADLPAAPRRDP